MWSESACTRVFANLYKTATTQNDRAGVSAGQFILGCRGPDWSVVSLVEVKIKSGVDAILEMIRNAPPPG
jgi:hypothetical protein